MTKTIQHDLLTPDIKVLFDEWALPLPEYTPDIYAFAKVIAETNCTRIGDMVVSFGLATREELERHARTKPANVMLLEHLSDKIDNLRPNTQKLLAANDKVAFYDSIANNTVHPALHQEQALQKFCIKLNCLPLQSSNESVIRLVFSDHPTLKEYRERSRIQKLSDPIGALCGQNNQTLVYGIAQRDQIAAILYSEQSETANAAEQEDQLNILVDNDAETDAIQLLVRILITAVERKSSNLQFVPLHNGTVEVYCRLHGDLVPVPNVRPLSPVQASEIFRYLHTKSVARYTTTHKRVEGRLLEFADGQLVFRTGTSETFLRCSYIPAATDSLAFQRESVSIRLLDRNAVTIHLERLKIAEAVIDQMRQHMHQKHGLVLVVGPTNSGKSTTIAGMVSLYREIHGNTRNLLSLEHPVERPLNGITQINVSQSRFESYMSAILRHDPNFIWVGEIRDRPSASTCVRASNTGQIVVSTLHSDDAAGALPALLAYISNTTGSSDSSIIVTPYDAINAISLIVAQRLVPVLCEHCRVPIMQSQSIYQEHIKRYQSYCVDNEYKPVDIKDTFVRNNSGCHHCDELGYVDDHPINEVIPITKPLRRKLTAMINQGQSDTEVLSKARTNSLHEDAMRLVLLGKLSLADALI